MRRVTMMALAGLAIIGTWASPSMADEYEAEGSNDESSFSADSAAAESPQADLSNGLQSDDQTLESGSIASAQFDVGDISVASTMETGPNSHGAATEAATAESSLSTTDQSAMSYLATASELATPSDTGVSRAGTPDAYQWSKPIASDMFTHTPVEQTFADTPEHQEHPQE